MYNQKIPLKEWIKLGRDTKHTRKLLMDLQSNPQLQSVMTKADREPLANAQNQLGKFRSRAEAVMFQQITYEQKLDDVFYGDKDFEELHPADKPS